MSQYSFATVPKAEAPRSKFSLNSTYKTALNSGYLVPFFVQDVLPGDTFTVTTSMIARLTTPLLPIMDNIHLDTFFFFVPNRLVWDNFEKFMGSQENPGDSIEFVEPQVDFSTAPDFQSIYDYAGIPPQIPLTQPDYPSAIPFRCMNLIWNEWFRDQNLQDSLEVRKDDGPDPLDLYELQKRNKRFDYFTSSLPFAQKGPAVMLPVGGTAPVVGNGMALGLTNGTQNFGIQNYTNQSVYFSHLGAYGSQVGSTDVGSFATSSVASVGVTSDADNSGLVADLSMANGTNVIEFRQALAMQRYLERLAVTGTRYTEYLRGIWGVEAPDARLQRPEFLGGSTDFINLQQVAQTSETTSNSPQGHLTAFGYSSNIHHGFQKSFVEHGWVIGFVNVWTDLTYQQGLPRMYSRRTQYDYANPYFAHIGMQPVLNKEIYLQSDEDENNAVFGYQERFGEYRFRNSLITGQMRSTAPRPLDAWHLAQKFENLPTLSSDFIEENPPLNRVLAVQDEPQIFLDAFFDFKAVRELPLYGIPGMGGRF